MIPPTEWQHEVHVRIKTDHSHKLKKEKEKKTAGDKLYHQLTPTFAPVPCTPVPSTQKTTNDECICSTRKTLVDDEEAWLTVLSNTCWRAACRQRPENSVPQLSLLFFSFLEGMAKNRLILEMFWNPVSLLWFGPRVVVTQCWPTQNVNWHAKQKLKTFCNNAWMRWGISNFLGPSNAYIISREWRTEFSKVAGFIFFAGEMNAQLTFWGCFSILMEKLSFCFWGGGGAGSELPP